MPARVPPPDPPEVDPLFLPAGEPHPVGLLRRPERALPLFEDAARLARLARLARRGESTLGTRSRVAAVSADPDADPDVLAARDLKTQLRLVA